MSKAPAFQFYPKDWLTDDKVMAMSNEEKGIYIDMLSIQFLNNGIDSTIFDKVVITPLLRRCFDLNPDDGKYRNKKLEKIRSAQETYAKRQSEAGKKGMKSRWNKEDDKVVTVPLLPKHNSSSSSSTASSKDKDSKDSCPEPKKPSAPDVAKIIFNYESSKFENISPEQVEIWKEAFPAVDIRGEIKRAGVWMSGNPTKRKKNVQRFLSNWLSRRQERGGGNGPAATGKAPPARMSDRYKVPPPLPPDTGVPVPTAEEMGFFEE